MKNLNTNKKIINFVIKKIRGVLMQLVFISYFISYNVTIVLQYLELKL